MKIIFYLSIILLFYIGLKLLDKFVKESILNLKEKQLDKFIENGLISINDFKQNNYAQFIQFVKIYLSKSNFKDITVEASSSSNLTIINATLNKEKVYINCVQNEKQSDNNTDDDFKFTNKDSMQTFLARTIQSQSKKGLFINNSSFENDAVKFINEYNLKNTTTKIILIDGYEIANLLRHYSISTLRFGDNYANI